MALAIFARADKRSHKSEIRDKTANYPRISALLPWTELAQCFVFLVSVLINSPQVPSQSQLLAGLLLDFLVIDCPSTIFTLRDRYPGDDNTPPWHTNCWEWKVNCGISISHRFWWKLWFSNQVNTVVVQSSVHASKCMLNLDRWMCALFVCLKFWKQIHSWIALTVHGEEYFLIQDGALIPRDGQLEL